MSQVPDDLTYRQRQRLWKLERDRADRAAGMAEFGGSETTADLVRQLRRRARPANRTARIVLAALIIVVIVGPVLRSSTVARLRHLRTGFELIP